MKSPLIGSDAEWLTEYNDITSLASATTRGINADKSLCEFAGDGKAVETRLVQSSIRDLIVAVNPKLTVLEELEQVCNLKWKLGHEFFKLADS